MGTISIHGLDKDTERKLRAESKRTGLSLNRTAKKLLAQALAKPPRGKKAASDDFADLAGSWTKKDYEEFQKATADFRKIDPEDWK
jgi:plasmid stability protein